MKYSLHGLFEEQAKLHPNNLAVKINNETISYKELDLQANKFANYLIQTGVQQGDVIKICLERSIEMFVGIIGILKCGAAYLPIDTDTPKYRLELLFKDDPNPNLVSNTICYNRLHQITAPHEIISLDNKQNYFTNCSSIKPEINLNKNTAAVILYTSGSTGTPKGVVLSHAALTNNILWHKDNYKHSEQDIVLQHASFTFDFSILEIFMALGCGGLLVLARQKFHYDGFYLIELIKKEKITIMGSAPSLLRAYIKFPEFANCKSLKKVFLGGEALDRNLVNAFFEKSNAELINIYGPTECSISVLHWNCNKQNKKAIVPIGLPIAGMKIHLLDKNKNPVKDQELGEIYISGPSVGTEYFKRPELTKEKFITQENKNEFLYKTGDLAKKNKDGVYYFHGRIDFQVKISGQRVELEEIEHCLSLHKDISNCLVRSTRVNEKDLKIIAYVILNKELNIEKLNAYLSKRMPKYMLPNIYIEVDKFELSPNGKIDITKLPKPDKNRIYTGISYQAAQNNIQKELIKIWEEILKISPIGIKDPYHLLGGDSLGNILIHQLIESKMGHKITIDTFLKAKTIESQAKIINQLNSDKKNTKVTYLREEGNKTPIIITQTIHSEGINFPLKLINNLPKNHPILATIPFGLDPSKLPISIEQAAEIYVADLLKISASEEYTLIGYSMGGLLASEICYLLEQAGKKIKHLYLLDSYHPKAIVKIVNHNTLNARSHFYTNKFIKANTTEKLLLLKYFLYFFYTRTKKLKTKTGRLSFILRPLVLIGIMSRTEKLCKTFGNKNFELAVKYNSKKIASQVVLILATDNNESYNYCNQTSSLSENILYFKNEVSEQINYYKVPFSHTSLLEIENIKTVTNIINEHISS